MNQKRIYILVSILLVLCVGCTKKSDIVIEQDMLQELEVEITSAEQEISAQVDTGMEQESMQVLSSQEDTGIYVHICGAVLKPGVYRMNKNERIYQAIEVAGGFSLNAHESYVNQSKPLEDGMKIWIPTYDEVAENNLETIQGEDEEIVSEKDSKVNLNTATESELCTLPGIGSSKAKSIIAYREQNGKFQKIEDIMKIEGIKEGSFEKLKSQITVQ